MFLKWLYGENVELVNWLLHQEQMTVLVVKDVNQLAQQTFYQ
jgi:hypothetical protein